MASESQAELYFELAEMAGGFIHELKNQINTLSLNLQLLAEDFESPESPRERRARDRANRLTDECRRLVELSNDFLRFARANQPNLVPMDLDTAVTRMVDFLTPTARAQNIDIVWHSSPELPTVKLDPELFDRMLLNLMLNAEDSMPNGGTMTLQARFEGGRVLLEVIDTGCGMAEDLVKKVFQPYVTTKIDGHGLGLATVRKIVLAHGGDITVRSELDRGTKFTVSLPVA